MSRRVHVAAFEDGHALVEAARACRERGLAIDDAFTPHPVHGLDEALGLRHSRLPIVCFAAGAAGFALATWFQHWSTATDWPLDVGGKPFRSLPAFLPVMFETMVLFAGLATAAALCLRSRLLPGKASRAPDRRCSDDRYLLVVQERDASVRGGELAALLRAHGAVECREELRDEPRAARGGRR